MQDKEIRKILIEYLEIRHRKCRIFQEKSIGTSICDLMLVTDHLTGFEIKSDCDNYERLPRQIRSYDQFFDVNYIVVGVSHAKSIESRIPRHWGILTIDQHSVHSVREARHNKTVNRARQLSLLWRIELKNILLRNSLPLYAQKSKAFLCKTISGNVPSDTLGRQIAEELFSRDDSLFRVDDQITSERTESAEDFSFPENEMIDRLSEEDLSSFTLDKWLAIYKRAAEKQERKQEYEHQRTEEYRRRQRAFHKVPCTDIEVSLGVPWVSAEIISQFAIEVLKVRQECYYNYDAASKKYYPGRKIPVVRYEKITGHWHVETCKKQRSPELTVIFGTKRFNAMQILGSTLNLRQIRIYDGNMYNEVETIAAIEKQKALQTAFKQWIWQDEDRKWEITEAYHRLFTEYGPLAFDGSKIEFSGMNPGIELFGYQKDAVQRIISTPNTLLSFDVGSGKTYIMIAAAMEMRKSGLSRKNMFVVPNHIVGQWEKMFTELYPKAKVLAVEPRSFTPDKRRKVLEQIQKEDYDGIILAYSCFEMIPLSANYLIRDMHDTLNRFEQGLREIQREGFPGAAAGVKREMDYVQKTVHDLIGCVSGISSDIPFDSLEINTLFVDEAHNYKNIPLRTTLKNIRGINAAGSKKCLEMLKKVHYVQKTNGGRGVVFATGTPLCNSISDTYAMQCYLQFEELKKKGLDRFDDWVKTFARPEEVCEIDVDTSGFRVVQRFREFFNLTELSKMFGQISIFHSVEQEHLPGLSGYTDVVIQKSGALDAYMKKLYARTEAIRTGSVDRKRDNMLKVSTDGRKAALSLALVGKEHAYDQQSKLWHCVQNLLEIYRQYDGCSQLVFCDYATPQNKQYSVYRELGKHLKAHGIPGGEIAYIHTCRNEEQKLKLYDAVNAGKVRILIGSTFKLGIGANVQTKLKAIHHLDVPWRPADMVQREGRILRRGNEHQEVFIFRYIVEGSFDSYSWQILQTKQHFISQFLSGNCAVRSMEDFDHDELNYAQVKALALSEPLMKQYAEKENELRRARMILRQEAAQRNAAKTEIAALKMDLEELRGQLQQTEANRLYIKENIRAITAAIDETAGQITAQALCAAPGTLLATLGEFGLKVCEGQSAEKFYAALERLGVSYRLVLGGSSTGNKTRIRNFFAKFDTQIQTVRERIAAAETQLSNLEQQLTYNSGNGERIARLECELKELFAEISQKTVL